MGEVWAVPGSRALWVAVLLSGGCAEPDLAVEVAGLHRVVPGAGLPDEVIPQDANNNLDVERFDGRLFLAFRTAPTHFASRETEMYVVSSADDGSTWDFEARVALGADVREPNFLAVDGTLHLYFAELGDNPLDFEPKGTHRITREGQGSWTGPAEALPVGFIPWRIKEVGGQVQLIGYTGGEDIYGTEPSDLEIHWLTTADGETWGPVVAGQPVVLAGGGSETDYAILEGGRLVAVVRNEAGDEMGFGSKICTAPADDLGNWDCAADPRKYDSPLVFQEAGRIWLLGRRNVTETGAYDLGRDDLDLAQQRLTYQGDYWYAPKRCSLWEVDPESRTVAFVLDLPSRGDTCFPEALPLGDGAWDVWNYSSDPDGPDWDWIEGQTHPTGIYRQTLTFTP